MYDYCVLSLMHYMYVDCDLFSNQNKIVQGHLKHNILYIFNLFDHLLSFLYKEIRKSSFHQRDIIVLLTFFDNLLWCFVFFVVVQSHSQNVEYVCDICPVLFYSLNVV